MLGFENHLNVFHEDKRALPENLAHGLAAFLNTTAVDDHFRRFNGHTQVNATDLRLMKYPSRARRLSRSESGHASQTHLTQAMLDNQLKKLSRMSDESHLANAHRILVSLGLPRAQQNERSALCLLALLNLARQEMGDAQNPLMGITPIMDWIRDHYKKTYAPNSRETVRRQTMHQFVDAGIAVYNPDKPSRPVNSPSAVYQIESAGIGSDTQFRHAGMA